MQNMNRLYRTFDLWVSPLYLLLSLLGGFIVIFPSKNIRRWCDGEREEKREERREGERNVIPPLSPPLSPPHCDGYDAGCIYHSPTRQVHILPPITSLHHRLSLAALFWSPFPSKGPKYRKGRYNPEKGLQTIGNLIDPASPYPTTTTNKKDR